MDYLIKSGGVLIARFLMESDRDCCIEALEEKYKEGIFEAAEVKGGDDETFS